MRKRHGFIQPLLMGFLSLIFMVFLLPILNAIIGPMTFDDPAVGFIFHAVPFLLMIIVPALIFFQLQNSATGGMGG
jgi:hypothetical protein